MKIIKINAADLQNFGGENSALKDVFANRNMGSDADVSEAVKAIIADVRQCGDEALMRYGLRFDGVCPESIVIGREQMKAAYDAADDSFRRAIDQSAANVRAFHKAQLRSGFEIKGENGVVIGQMVIPLERVGIYVPGGTASYPSTVLMNAIPAKLAGVKRVVMVTPPQKGDLVKREVLAAAWVSGVDVIYAVGGAQAVAALAYGTQTVEKVDKIVGPGNIFVATAKRLVSTSVGIDMFAGPSEIMIIADESANPRYVAADMLSQAEHDKRASALLITDSPMLIERVEAELKLQLASAPRREIAQAAIDGYSRIVLCDSLSTMTALANEFAPEHLEICCENPSEVLKSIRNAGSVFLGNYTPEPVGDYYAGLNHTLPTTGTAKFSSALSVDDFVKKQQYAYYTREALESAAEDIVNFAQTEGLDAHANAIRVRFE